MAQNGSKWPKIGPKWLKIGPKWGVIEHFGAILSHFNPILGHFRPILSHFEDVASVWERPWAAKAYAAVKIGVRERPKPSARSKRGSKWLNGPN